LAEHLVVWDADAVLEFEELRSPKERMSVFKVVDLVARTRSLEPPHAKSLKGEPGLLELRPRQGRSHVRPIYRRSGSGFVILAVSVRPDKADFEKAVQDARARCARYEVDNS
jgi:hypothetical protein